MSPDERARRAAEVMWHGDNASAWFGMALGPVTEGAACLTLTVARQHCNGHGICHGGVTFALADSAFAFAANSRNRRAVAQHTMMSFLAPAQEGDRLTATARETATAGRSGVYDVSVTTEDGTQIAEFRGISREIPGHLFDEEDGETPQ